MAGGLMESFGLPLRELLLAMLFAAAGALLTGNLSRALALRLGAVAWPRQRDVHVTPTPRWGGLSIFAGIALGVVIAHQLPALSLAFDYTSEVLGVIVGAVVLIAVGMLDDMYDLDALTKFSAQVLAAGVMTLGGNQWSEVWLPFGGEASEGPGSTGTVLILGPVQATLVTVAVTVTLINAVNFIDGLDGLAAGIGASMSAAGFLFSLNLIRENGNDASAYTPALLQAVTLGACLGYLYHSFHPTRIFMGDTGSMLLGFMISAGVIGASGRVPPGTEPENYFGLLSPIVAIVGVVLIPVGDLLFAVIRRLRAGRSIFAPDKKHLHHRLLELGHGHRRTVILLVAWSFVIGLGSVSLSIGVQVAYIVSLISIAAVILAIFTLHPPRPVVGQPPANRAPTKDAVSEIADSASNSTPDPAGELRRLPSAQNVNLADIKNRPRMLSKFAGKSGHGKV